MHPYLRLVRIGNVGVSFVGTVVGALAAAGAGLALGGPTVVAVGLAALSTALVTSGGNVLNDLRDRATDRVNHPDRPLVTGAVSEPAARRLVVALLVAALLVVLPVVERAPALLPILASAVGAVLLYEYRAKAAGLGGNLLVAYLTGAVFLYGGAAGGNVRIVWPLALMAVLATLSREVIKDMEDAEGDVDRRTFPRTHGLPASAAVARIAVGLALAVSVVPFATGLAGTGWVELAYAALVAVADAIFVASVLPLPRGLHRAQGLSKGAMTVALGAFLATAFR